MDKAVLVEDADGAEGAVGGATEGGVAIFKLELASNVVLVEDGDDLVAGLEALDILADGENGTGAVGAGDDVVDDVKGVQTLGNDKITVLNWNLSVFK